MSLGLLGPVGLSACTAAQAPSPTPTTEARTVAPLPESGDIDAGTHLVTSFTENFEITVPDGWSADGDESTIRGYQPYRESNRCSTWIGGAISA